MSENVDKYPLRRLLVASDASPPSLAALDLACELAQRHDAEVTVLFVEDAGTHRLVNLPGLVEIRRVTATVGAFTAADLRRQYRARARRLHQALEIIQRRIEISCRLEVVQGTVNTEIVGATEDADLVLIGGTGVARNRRGLGSTARHVLLEARRPVMVVQQPPPPAAPVVVIYNESAAGERALSMAVTLAEAHAVMPVHILMRDGSPDAVKKLRETLADQHPDLQSRLGIRKLTPMELYSLYQISYAERPGLLVLPHDDEHAEETSIEEFLKYADHPLVVVR